MSEEAPPRSPEAVLGRIPGSVLDPEPKTKPTAVHRLEDRFAWIGVAWSSLERFKASRSPLLAAGTAYYGFIAMFSLLALVYGVAALLSADAVAEWLTETLQNALPGLVGEQGIDPDTLEPADDPAKGARIRPENVHKCLRDLLGITGGPVDKMFPLSPMTDMTLF